MKKILLLLSVVLTALQLSAAQVDLAAAQAKAKQCLQTRVLKGKTMAPAMMEPQLILSEMSKSHANAAVYYIFNTDQNFIIVAGDDRAEEILAVGDRPLNIDRMPDNMKAWLKTYAEQIDYLFDNPDIQVEKPFKANVMLNATTVEPLLKELWDQDAPYYNQCNIGGYQCLTGCPATSAAMVFHYWQYPTDPTPVVPAYRTNLSYSYWSSSPVNVPALPSVTFDWENMLDSYRGGYTTQQGDAVATLMRYVGQAERMDYGTYAAGGSGIDSDSVINIANAFIFFGYDETTVRAVKKTSSYSGGRTLYTDAEWAEMIQTELAESRPIVYCAISSEGGHAFNVDGYNADDNTYHVNYGWSGDGNGDFALNAFRDGSAVFNQYQQMVIGIQPPVQGPVVKVSTRKIDLATYTNEPVTATFTVKGKLLTDDIKLELADENEVFSIDNTQVALSDTEEGKEVTVTFLPKLVGNYTATIALTSTEAKEAMVTINGTATLRKYIPELDEAEVVADNSFKASWTDQTPEENVVDYTLVVNQQGFERAEEVAKADFTSLNNTALQSDPLADLDTYCTPAGWTGTVYPDKGGVRLGYSSSQCEGTLTTAPLDFNMSGGRLTITFTAKTYGGGTASLLIQTGENTFTQTLKSRAKTYTIVMDCDVFDQQTVSFTSKNSRVFLSDVTITTTDITGNGLRTAPAEQGDDASRTITGITDMNYVVEGLMTNKTYHFKVQANYIDGTSSRWSASKKVVLGQEFDLGDVNGDGTVDVSDVNIVLNIMLGLEQAETYNGRADMNGDGEIDLADVNMVINKMLGQ